MDGKNNFTYTWGVGTHFFVHFIAENLDVPKLERTINQLISRHDMLRGVIINGQQQVLKKFLIIPLKRIISLQKKVTLF